MCSITCRRSRARSARSSSSTAAAICSILIRPRAKRSRPMRGRCTPRTDLANWLLLTGFPGIEAVRRALVDDEFEVRAAGQDAKRCGGNVASGQLGVDDVGLVATIGAVRAGPVDSRAIRRLI